MDLINHYIKNESLVEIPTDFKQLISEGTETASKVEKGICMAHNILKNKGDEVKAKAASSGWDWLDPVKEKDFIAAGEAIVGSSVYKGAKLGDVLHHAGTSTAPTHYDKGGDNTSKADFYDDNKNYVSLKDSGAQLSSAKAGETEGILLHALDQMAYAFDWDVLDGVSDILELVETKLADNASNRVYVKIGKAKGVFKKWWIGKGNPRYHEVEKQATAAAAPGKKVKPTQIANHLKKELANVGGSQKATNPTSGLLPGVKPLSPDEAKRIINAFNSSDPADIEDAKVSLRHIEKRMRNGATEADFSKEALEEQVKWVIDSSIDQSEWEDVLNNWTSQSKNLRTCIIYEAASGEGKFTGDAKMTPTGSYTGDVNAVANRMMVFSGSGPNAECAEYYDDMWEWAEKHNQLASQINISFKGSGTDYYAKLGISTELKLKPLKEHKQACKVRNKNLNLDKIISEEYSNLMNDLKPLNLTEGFSLIKYAKDVATKIKDKIVNFFSRVYNRVTKVISEWGKKGLKYLAEMMGWKLGGSCKIGRVP